MEDIYSKALKEVYEVLNNSEENVRKKIPNKFYEFIEDNMDKEYSAKINFFNPEWEESVQEETKAILALIYRDYIVDEKIRQKLMAEEKEEQKNHEEELRKKYNPDNIFNNKEYLPKKKEREIVFIKKLRWYQKILKLFIKKKI